MASKMSAVVMMRVSMPDLVRRQAARIAAAVQALVVGAGDRRQFAERADARQDGFRVVRHAA